jgi:AraC-like DNA-binding protein
MQPVPDATPLTFLPYSSHTPIVKGRSALTRHVISLISEGEKIIHTGGSTVHVTTGNILLLAAGNYLYTERFEHHQQMKSIMVFFDDALLQNALGQISTTHRNHTSDNTTRQPYSLFAKDLYIENYINSIYSLLNDGAFSQALQLTKLNELLLFLYSRYPEQWKCFLRSTRQRPDEERIKQVMEENLQRELSISELAFLCHMSLPTFKRKFQQLYQQSPARWVQQRRLAHAADLLRRKGAKPADVYLEAGYENHSSFSKAFKMQFGVLPKDY